MCCRPFLAPVVALRLVEGDATQTKASRQREQDARQ